MVCIPLGPVKPVAVDSIQWNACTWIQKVKAIRHRRRRRHHHRSPQRPSNHIQSVLWENIQENEIISFKLYRFRDKNDRIKKKNPKLIQLIHLVYLYEDERDTLSDAVKCHWNWLLKTSNWIEGKNGWAMTKISSICSLMVLQHFYEAVLRSFLFY